LGSAAHAPSQNGQPPSLEQLGINSTQTFVEATTNVTFNEQAEIWLKECANRKKRPLEQTTLDTGRYALDKWMYPFFGDKLLANITRAAGWPEPWASPLHARVCCRRFESTHQDWHSYFLKVTLIAATVGTLTPMAFSLSWTHSGGSPHGGQPRPGLWLALRPIATWSVIATTVTGVFGKGRSRLLVIGSAISIFCVIYFLAALEMDFLSA
jgi:hypothetical protein